MSRSLVIVSSYHHRNTEKVAKVFAKILDAEIRTPQQVDPEELQEYGLIGFGSGIYDGMNHRALLDLVDRLPQITDKEAFIFSTSGVTKRHQPEMHLPLIGKLKAKGYTIVGEFNCKGFNTNSFLRVFGGMNKGRPNAEDLKRAEEIAQDLRERLKRKIMIAESTSRTTIE